MTLRVVAGGLAAFVLAACDNPQGRTDRFLAESAKRAEDVRGKVPPLPDYKPKEVTPLVIERNPFKR